MKIPKYIDRALEQRAKSAQKLVETDTIVTDFIVKNNINAEYDDYMLSIGIFENPYGSSDRVRQAILEKE